MRRFFTGFVLGVAVVPLAGVAYSLLGLASVSATDNPPRWESFLARKAFAASISRSAPRLQNPIAPSSANLTAGLKSFRSDCAGCHGDAGKPSQWGMSDFYPRIPQFDSDPPRKPDWQMFQIVKHGVRYTGMGAWDTLMPDDDIWKIVTFLGHLKNLPPDVEAQWRGNDTARAPSDNGRTR